MQEVGTFLAKALQMTHLRKWRFGALFAVVLGAACASTPGAQPDDMSATDHRKHADAEDQRAKKDAERYDPNATADTTIQAGTWAYDTVTYNPTAIHLDHAREHGKHAKDHRAAAAELEKFEQGECKLFPPETRKVCPLLGTVEEVEDVEGGVRIRLHDKLDRKAALDHVKCHLAYAGTEGNKGMDGCPLYIGGVTVTAGADKKVIELKAGSPETVPELRKRTRDHVAP